MATMSMEVLMELRRLLLVEFVKMEEAVRTKKGWKWKVAQKVRKLISTLFLVMYLPKPYSRPPELHLVFIC
jgi:hypothetical protein